MAEKHFTNFGEYVQFIEKKYPRRGEPEATYAHKIAAGWRCECARSGRDPVLKPKPLTPGEREATEEEAAQWRDEARRQGQLAANYVNTGTPAAELADDWLAYTGRSQDGRLLE